MSATKLDGTLYRDEIFADLAQRVAALKDKGCLLYTSDAADDVIDV